VQAFLPETSRRHVNYSDYALHVDRAETAAQNTKLTESYSNSGLGVPVVLAEKTTNISDLRGCGLIR
ncbi:MAG: hypothetical protein M3Z75_24600, partial [Actinomycetota bacterium]|nr:hypothetical protein [Actinomycetota bacterium]